jgi:hypothetical protein
MIPVEELPADSFGSEPGAWDPDAAARVGEPDWHTDVALEMWIDATAHPVSIRLAGVLDSATGANLMHVVEDCMAEGQRDFTFDTAALVLDLSGREVLERITDRVHGSGGSVQLDLVTR